VPAVALLRQSGIFSQVGQLYQPEDANQLIRVTGSGERSWRALQSQARDVAGNDPELCAAIQDQAHLIIADAERETPQPADLISARAEANAAPGSAQPRPTAR
jgi:hypothetical protein